MTGDSTTLQSGATVAAQISTEHFRYTSPNPITTPDMPVLAAHVIYTDLRNRNYAA